MADTMPPSLLQAQQQQQQQPVQRQHAAGMGGPLPAVERSGGDATTHNLLPLLLRPSQQQQHVHIQQQQQQAPGAASSLLPRQGQPRPLHSASDGSDAAAMRLLLLEAAAVVRSTHPQLADRLAGRGGEELLAGVPDAGAQLRQLLEGQRALAHTAAESQAGMEEQADEYEAETARLAQLLRACGLAPSSLPPRARDALDALAGLANELELLVPTEHAMSAAWAQLSLDNMRARQLGAALSTQRAGLARAVRGAGAAAEALSASMSAARGRLARADRQLQVQVLQYWPDVAAKVSKYTDQADRQRKELDETGLRPELKHSSVVAHHTELEALQQQLGDAERRVASFRGLPPSLEHARLQLRQLHQAHAALQEKLHKGLGLQG